jgi:hypothetical protein
MHFRLAVRKIDFPDNAQDDVVRLILDTTNGSPAPDLPTLDADVRQLAKDADAAKQN